MYMMYVYVMAGFRFRGSCAENVEATDGRGRCFFHVCRGGGEPAPTARAIVSAALQVLPPTLSAPTRAALTSAKHWGGRGHGRC